MPATPITDWGTAFMTSMAAALALLLGGIPKLIAFVFILIVGWIVATILGNVVTGVLRRIEFERIAERTGLRGFVRQMGMQMTASQLIGDLAKWLVRLVTLVVAFDALGLPAVSQALQSLLLWLPNLAISPSSSRENRSTRALGLSTSRFVSARWRSSADCRAGTAFS